MPASRKLLWNTYSGGAAALTAVIGSKAIASAWRYVTGEEPPKPGDPRTPVAQAIGWVLLTSIGLGLVQVLVNRTVARRWSVFTGEDAPAVRSATLKL